MSVLFQIRELTSNSLHQVVTFSHHQYILSNGMQLRVETEPAWCSSCQHPVEAECIPSHAELRSRLAACERQHAYPGLISEEVIRVECLEELKLRVAWRSTRRSHARCLECFGDSIIPLRTGLNSVDQAVCLSLDSRGLADVSGPKLLLTPEGMKAGR